MCRVLELASTHAEFNKHVCSSFLCFLWLFAAYEPPSHQATDPPRYFLLFLLTIYGNSAFADACETFVSVSSHQKHKLFPFHCVICVLYFTIAPMFCDKATKLSSTPIFPSVFCPLLKTEVCLLLYLSYCTILILCLVLSVYSSCFFVFVVHNFNKGL